LQLQNNQLTGTIPPSIGNLLNLGQLLLGDNKLTGTIPPTIVDLTQLNTLELQDNQLSGSIPLLFANLVNLQTLYLYNNSFTCINSLPTNIAMCTLQPNPWNCSDPCCDWVYLSANYPGNCDPVECLNITTTLTCNPLQTELDNGFAFVTGAVVVNGNLTVPSKATLEITVHGFVNVSGCVSIEGAIVLDLQNQLLNNNTNKFGVLTASCFIGNGTNTTVSNHNKCQKVTSTAQAVTGNTLFVLVGSSDTCGSHTNVIAGAVAGGVAGLLILTVIIVVLSVPSLKKKVFPFHPSS